MTCDIYSEGEREGGGERERERGIFDVKWKMYLF